MTILKTLYCIFAAACIVLGTWAIASYIDAAFNALLQPWNMWALLLGL